MPCSLLIEYTAIAFAIAAIAFSLFSNMIKSSNCNNLYFFNQIKGIERLETFEREVNLNADQKRLWFEKIRDVNDRKLIDSVPISMNYFTM